MGYCVANKWAYRKATQSCDKFEKGTVFIIRFSTMDYEGTVSNRAILVKAATETEARVWFDQKYKTAFALHVEAKE